MAIILSVIFVSIVVAFITFLALSFNKSMDELENIIKEVFVNNMM